MIKKTIILSFIAILAFGAPAFAQNTQTSAKELKVETLTKKQKIEADLRSTSNKLKVAVNKTQKLLDLLSKNDKDTSLAQESLDSANTHLEEANEAIDQYAGILPEVNPADKKTKEVVLIKEPLKKAQESLKSAKASLIESIKILKEGLAPKDNSEE
jgi:chromosome segregation ATPase